MKRIEHGDRAGMSVRDLSVFIQEALRADAANELVSVRVSMGGKLRAVSVSVETHRKVAE